MKHDDPLYNYFQWQKQNKKVTDKFCDTFAKAFVYGTAYALTRNCGKKRKTYSYRTYSLDWSQRIDIDVYTGETSISITQNGYNVYDTSLLNKIKRTPEYFNANQEMYLEYHEHIVSLFTQFTEGYKKILKPYTLDEINNLIANLQIQTYNPTKFEMPKPQEKDALALVQKEAAKNVTSWKFWKIKKLRQDYVNQNLQNRYNELVNEWAKSKARFERSEDEIASRENKKYKEEYDQKIQELQKKKDKDYSLISKNVNNVSEQLFHKYGITIFSELHNNAHELDLTVQVPIENVLPICHIVADSRGKLKSKKYTIKEHKGHLIAYIFNMMYVVASEFFNQSIYLENITMLIKANKNLDANDTCLDNVARINFNRNLFCETNFGQFYPYNDITRFQHNITVTKSCTFKDIKDNNINMLSNNIDVFAEDFDQNLLNIDLNIGYYTRKR